MTRKLEEQTINNDDTYIYTYIYMVKKTGEQAFKHREKPERKSASKKKLIEVIRKDTRVCKYRNGQ